MKLSDTFVNAPLPDVPSHLWVVVSAPDVASRVVIVNFSSDNAALQDLDTVETTEHPWLKYKSFIRCDLAKLAPVESLQSGVKGKVLTPERPASPELVKKLQSSLVKSKHTRREIKKVLTDQGLP